VVHEKRLEPSPADRCHIDKETGARAMSTISLVLYEPPARRPLGQVFGAYYGAEGFGAESDRVWFIHVGR